MSDEAGGSTSLQPFNFFYLSKKKKEKKGVGPSHYKWVSPLSHLGKPPNFCLFEEKMGATKLLLTDLATGAKNVPTNYIRPISDRPNLSDVQKSDVSIPLIDLQGFHGPNHSAVIKQIGHACQSHGFFQVCM